MSSDHPKIVSVFNSANRHRLALSAAAFAVVAFSIYQAANGFLSRAELVTNMSARERAEFNIANRENRTAYAVMLDVQKQCGLNFDCRDRVLYRASPTSYWKEWSLFVLFCTLTLAAVAAIAYFATRSLFPLREFARGAAGRWLAWVRAPNA